MDNNPDSQADKMPDAQPRVSQFHLPNWRDIVAIVGTVGTIFFGGLSLYLYEAAKIKPELTFGVHPLKTELQRPDFDKQLGFIYGGTPVESESITSVQVSIWNAGKRSIRDSDILAPIRLVMPKKAPILSARVKKPSREVCGFQSLENRDDFKGGICHLKWRILEPGDGAVLQIIYAGGSQNDLAIDGIVEGQSKGIVVEKYALSRENKTIRPTRLSISAIVFSILLLLIASSLMFVAGRMGRTEAAKQIAEEKKVVEQQLEELKKRAARQTRPIEFILLGTAVLILFGAAWLLFWSHSSPGPPFGW